MLWGGHRRAWGGSEWTAPSGIERSRLGVGWGAPSGIERRSNGIDRDQSTNASRKGMNNTAFIAL